MEKIGMLEKAIPVLPPSALPSKSLVSLRIRLPKTFVHLQGFKVFFQHILPKSFVRGF